MIEILSQVGFVAMAAFTVTQCPIVHENLAETRMNGRHVDQDYHLAIQLVAPHLGATRCWKSKSDLIRRQIFIPISRTSSATLSPG